MVNKKIRVWLMAVSVFAGNLTGLQVCAQESDMAYEDQNQSGEIITEYSNENYPENEMYPGEVPEEETLPEYIPQEQIPEDPGVFREEYSDNWQEDMSEGGEEEPNSTGLYKKPFDEEVFTLRNSRKENFIEDFKIKKKEDAEKDFDLQDYSEIPIFRYLDVPEIKQLPELPTGCESVSLTMALNYEGFDLEKTVIAREFLIYNNETDNMAVGYIGDPFSEDGAGCFAPAIAATADSFFEDQGYDYEAYDISGTDLEELLCYVASGTPVVIWTTMYMAEPEFTEEHGEYDGKEYQWYRQEHCVVLSGYDTEEETLQINDPLEGIVKRDLNEFKAIYDATGKCAVVVSCKKSGTAIDR